MIPHRYTHKNYRYTSIVYLYLHLLLDSYRYTYMYMYNQFAMVTFISYLIVSLSLH